MTLESTDGIKTNRDIIQPMISVFKLIHKSLPIIVERPNVPRPKTSYLSIRVLTPVGKIGNGARDSSKCDSEGNWLLCGQRQFTLSVKAYLVINDQNRDEMDNFHDPQDLLSEITDRLEDPSFNEQLRSRGLSVFGTSQILDVTELIETGYESRAQLDLFMGVASNRAADLGEIEKVEFTGTYDGDDEDAIAVEGT